MIRPGVLCDVCQWVDILEPILAAKGTDLVSDGVQVRPAAESLIRSERSQS